MRTLRAAARRSLRCSSLLAIACSFLSPFSNPDPAEAKVGYGPLVKSRARHEPRRARRSDPQDVRSRGRIAQLVRAPALHAGCRGFESLFAHALRLLNE